jgi:hypothetical protein
MAKIGYSTCRTFDPLSGGVAVTIPAGHYYDSSSIGTCTSKHNITRSSQVEWVKPIQTHARPLFYCRRFLTHQVIIDLPTSKILPSTVIHFTLLQFTLVWSFVLMHFFLRRPTSQYFPRRFPRCERVTRNRRLSRADDDGFSCQGCFFSTF